MTPTSGGCGAPAGAAGFALRAEPSASVSTITMNIPTTTSCRDRDLTKLVTHACLPYVRPHAHGSLRLRARSRVPAHAWHIRAPRRPVSYTHLRAHETPEHLVCRLL